MFKLTNAGVTVAEAAGPFIFDENERLWISGDQRIYDFDRTLEQVAEEEPEGADYRRSSAPPPSPPPAPHITRRAFLDRFTDAEAISFDLASIGATVEAATMRRFMQKVNAATYIDLSDEDTRAGVIQLEEAKLLQSGRSMEILGAEVKDRERYRGV